MIEHDEKARARVVERIAEVRSRFIAGLDARTSELAALSRRASIVEGDPQAARDALRLGLHNLSGASPTLGLQALGRRAAELEAKLLSAPRGLLQADFAETLARDVAALSKEPN